MQATKRVLIVEDEEILAGNLKAHLDRGSCDTRVANDGAGAIRLVEAFTPEVLVLDYRLPDMDGFEVFDAIRCRCECASCILMTGHPCSEVYDGAMRRGIEHILFKPFPLLDLSTAVRLASTRMRLPAPTDALPAANAPSAGLPERRSHARRSFPMRLLDGTWLFADRRQRAKD